MQAHETAELVSRRGWSLADRFVDEGISGSHDRRPGFRSMLDGAKRRTFDILVVYRADRLFRSLRELVITLHDLGELGIDFVSVHEAFDSTTASGKMMLQMIGVFAEFERNILIERTRSGLAEARRRGAKLGRPRRYVDVERAKRLLLAGVNHEAIARELDVGLATLYRALSPSKPS